MEEYGMWRNIVRHSLVVERAASCIAEALIRAGEYLNLAEVKAGALLHDITKTRSIKTRENHACTGQMLLQGLGFPRIGEIVGSHVLMPPAIFAQNVVSAEEVVHYADKRVLHDRIVSLVYRFDDLMVRYGTSTEACRKLKTLETQSQRIEAKIFSRVDFEPEALSDIVNA